MLGESGSRGASEQVAQADRESARVASDSLDAWSGACAAAYLRRWALRLLKSEQLNVQKQRERLLLKLNHYVTGAAQQLIEPDAVSASLSSGT